MSVVVDASVACKWLVMEGDTLLAVTVLEREEPLLAPDFIVAEVCSVLWKKRRMGEISEQHTMEAVEALPGFFDELVPTAALGETALNIALTLDHPVYDCFYLALAQSRKCQMITADKRLLGRLAVTEWASLAIDLKHQEERP